MLDGKPCILVVDDLDAVGLKKVIEKHFRKPVIVHDFPKDIKAFYMRVNDDGKTVAAMDVLVPKTGEIIGGSQREERRDVLERRMVECGLAPRDYWWYLDLRRYGTVPHAGFGLGFERTPLEHSGNNRLAEKRQSHGCRDGQRDQQAQ